MRKAILIPIIFTSVLSLIAQSKEVAQIPFNIDAKFKQEFPGAQKVEWHKRDGYFQADYLQNNKLISVFYNKLGDCQEIERQIDVKDIPASVLTKLSGALPDYEVKKAFVMDDFSTEPVFVLTVESSDNYYTARIRDQHKPIFAKEQGVFIF